MSIHCQSGPFKLKLLALAISASIILLPSTLNSADIYISSRGAVRVEAVLNKYILPDDSKLGGSMFVVSTPKKVTNINLDIPCAHTDTILGRTEWADGRAIFIVRSVIHSPCDTATVRVGIDGRVFTDTETTLGLIHTPWIVSELSDRSDDALTQTMRSDTERANTLLAPSDDGSANPIKKLERLRDRYEGNFLTLRSDLSRMILDERARGGYISPVAGYEVPLKEKLIPGTGRPYRRDTTDGIHHGWDIMAPYGTSVRALGKWVIIRIVSDWKWKDFDRLKRGNQLSEDDRLRNLDIFRGNQVWLKTMDGNVTFYSHLSQIDPNIRVGSVVESGTRLGAIGKSGVPDPNYRDFHLHFEIQRNPHTGILGIDDLLSVMRWDYVGKGESRSVVRDETKKIFVPTAVLLSAR